MAAVPSGRIAAAPANPGPQVRPAGSNAY
jgi:hypothetical protein